MSVPSVPVGDGNTDSSPPTKKVNPVIHYCFTFNNYNDVVLSVPEFCEKLQKICKKYVFQEEVGEKGTPHLQGYFELLKKDRITSLKKKLYDEIHFEPTRNIEASIAYSQKEETRAGKIYKYGFPREIKIIDNLFDWQSSIVDMLSKEPDDRSIIWIYDPKGNCGKTSLLKYLVYHKKAIFTCGGKNGDIINLIFNNKNYMINHDNTIVLWNLPRTTSSEYISYNAIESIKDGLIANNKFECGSFICPNPHVCIFANCLPDTSTLTKDRWKIYTIVNNKLVDYISHLTAALD